MDKKLQRLIDEKSKLSIKISKMEDFMESEDFKLIDPIEMSIMNIQLSAMKTYDQCLLERITWNK